LNNHSNSLKSHGGNGPLRRVMEDGSLIADWNQGGNSSLKGLWMNSPFIRL